MIEASGDGETRRQAAADWVLRLRAPDCDEADWQAFEGWLQAAPDSREAFDDAMSLWLSLDQGPKYATRAASSPRRRAPVRPQFGAPVAWAGGALAAGLALAVMIAPGLVTSPVTQTTYATAKAERRSVQLADGTRIDLGGGSRITVKMSRLKREVEMAEGEVAFNVTHDARRPFVVKTADRTVEDLGTEFNIRARRDELAVTVRRGSVQVAPLVGGHGDSVALVVGQRLRHSVGAVVSQVDQVSADDVFAWRQGRLIYRDQPLQTVVDDLNQYFPTPIRVDPRAAALRFSGVLTVDAEEATVRRLAMLLPVSDSRRDGEIMLKSRGDSH
jgi:transmembrane sensor